MCWPVGSVLVFLRTSRCLLVENIILEQNGSPWELANYSLHRSFQYMADNSHGFFFLPLGGTHLSISASLHRRGLHVGRPGGFLGKGDGGREDETLDAPESMLHHIH